MQTGDKVVLKRAWGGASDKLEPPSKWQGRRGTVVRSDGTRKMYNHPKHTDGMTEMIVWVLDVECFEEQYWWYECDIELEDNRPKVIDEIDMLWQKQL